LTIFYQQIEKNIVISGKTFPYKDQIKAIGARFDGKNKTWIIPFEADKLNQVAKLCAASGGGQVGQQQPQTITDNIDKEITRSQGANTDLTVSDLMYKASLALTQAFPRSIWVIGELQNISERKHGLFLNLAEPKENGSKTASVTVNATIWSRNLDDIKTKHGRENLNLLLEEGLKGRFLCKVSLYKDRGNITLNIIDIDPNFTKGALALAREELLKELRTKGLDKKNPALPLTDFPLSIGLVSAADSRAHSDFLDQLNLYNFPGKTHFFPAQMQGEAVLTSVVAALQSAVNNSCDAIVITRGGGSAADLRWFDSKEVAIAIAHCPIPIIAAIGHQDDVCIAEEISFRREKTPTAAADFLLHIVASTLQRLQQSDLKLKSTLSSRFDNLSNTVSLLREKLSKTKEASIFFRSQQLITIEKKLYQTRDKAINQAQETIVKNGSNLKQAAKENVFAKTMSITRWAHLINTEATKELDHLDKAHLILSGQLKQSSLAAIFATEAGINSMRSNLNQNANEGVFKTQHLIDSLKSKLTSKDPKPWINTGWTRLESVKGQLNSVRKIKVGDLLKAKLKDGTVQLEIKNILTMDKK